MSTEAAPQARRPFAWWVVLCLVGLDYFSSLAYLPSIAVGLLVGLLDEGRGEGGVLAPIAGLGVVLITLLAAVPVYWYVVGRSHQGHGGVGLLERVFHGWRGKLLILALLGFIATDLVITRSLSTSDASAHVTHNAAYRSLTDPIRTSPAQEAREPTTFSERFVAFWNEQLILTVVLSVLTFGLYFFLVRSLDRGFVWVAVGVVALYLLVNVLLIGGALGYLFLTEHGRELVVGWEEKIRPTIGDVRAERGGPLLATLKLALLAFPAMAIGLSGFELSMASAPMVRGSANDDPYHPVGRIRRTRLLMLLAGLVMSVLVLSAIFVVTLLVYQDNPAEPGKRHLPAEAVNRSLSYLAHGGKLEGSPRGSDAIPFTGSVFGFVYDLSSILILCLAGASATITLKDVVPHFLSRFGMQMAWAHKVGVITHLFNGTILIVTVAFQASVEAMQWAYAASVLALLFGASLAATLDVRQRLRGSIWRWPLSLPFLLATLLFAAMGVLILWQNPAGVAIALAFVAVVLVTAIVSRYVRSTELRFQGFEFERPQDETRWQVVSRFEFQVLVPHDPDKDSLRHREEQIRERHRLSVDVPIIFIEVRLGDPSDFHQKPLMRIDDENGEDVIRVSRCTSVAHVIAAIALEFREVGQPPELHFGWSEESPMAANLNFVLLGHGNIPWMVNALIRRSEPKPERRPRVMIG